MAMEAPSSIDVTEYQFKLHDRLAVFGPSAQSKSNVNLLATSSAFGLLFLGDQNRAEIKVIQLQRFVDAKDTGQEVLARIVPVPGVPHSLAVSSDGSLLAVNYTLNGSALLAIYSVPSFLSANITCKNLIRIAADDNVQALQILWNPVMATMFALVLSDGSLSVYNLNDTAFEFCSIDKQEQAKCASWSPKGKQIVVGFHGGKLAQYKPDLKLARTIACPPNVHDNPFDTIAVQWLSTYQFAAVFLQQGEDKSPCLHIVNAPKVGPPTYINYYDICYSSTGPRAAQIFLTHILPWNILLMATSNGMEVGILGTTEAGETPTWKQYITPDEARIELPLTSDKQETHPIGFALETGTSHQLIIAEKQIPVMPMVHILSTHGTLVSFNFLNFSSNSPGICSPPQPISDLSGLVNFQPIVTDESGVQPGAHQQFGEEKNVAPIQQQQQQTPSEVSFTLPNDATSTPAQDRKIKPLFGNNNVAGSGNLFGNFASSGSTTPSLFAAPAPIKPAATTASIFGGALQTSQGNSTGPLSFGGGQPLGQKPTGTMAFATKPGFGMSSFGQSLGTGTTAEATKPALFGNAKEVSAPALVPNKSISFAPQDSSQNKTVADRTKPLYTVPPTYTASQQHQSMKKDEVKQKSADLLITSEDNDILKESINEEIQAFELELRDLSKRSKDIDITIGSVDESKDCVKKLNELQELSDQALESTESLSSDIQVLRHSLNECFVMIAETKSKLNMFNNPDLPQLGTMSNLNQTNRRQLIKLKSMVATNEAQLQIVNQQIDAQWSNYQDLCRKSRTKMRIPSLEGVYQTLMKQKDILARERLKLNYIKSRLGMKGMVDQKENKKNDVTIESLADSILSMSLSEQVKAERSYFTEEKLQALRNILQNRKIVEIKPHRPDRIGVNSEVIQEVRIRTARQREGASTKPEKMEKQRIKNETQHIAKPTPTKPIVVPANYPVANKPQTKLQQNVPVKVTPVSKAAPSAALPFNNSGIIKPTATTQPNKEIGCFAPMSTATTGFNFGGNTLQKNPSSLAIPFGGSSSGSVLSFGTAPATTTTSSQLSFGAVKDEKQFVKPTPSAGISLQPSLNENLAKETSSLPFSFQPKQPAFESQPKSTFFLPKLDSNASGFTAPIIKAASVTPETKPIESIAQAKIEKGTKLTTASTPFTAVSLSQSSSFGSPSNFNIESSIDKTTESNVAKSAAEPVISSIFGGQTTITKHASIFGTSGQTVSSSEHAEKTYPKVFATPAASIFTPLSLASDDGTSPAATTAVVSPSAASTFSFVSKASAESATDPSAQTTTTTTTSPGFGFPASTAAAPSTNFGFALSAATTVTTSAPVISTFSFADFAKTTAPIESTAVVTTSTSADPTDSLFGNLNICKPTALEILSAAAAQTTTVSNAFAGSLFNSSSFETAATTTASIFGSTSPASTTASIFSTPSTTPTFGNLAITSVTAPASPTTKPASFFSSPTLTTPPAPSTATSVATPSIAATFGVTPAAPPTTGSGIFGGIPKPDQSVFGVQTAPPTTATNSPFGGITTPSPSSPFSTPSSAQPTSGGNLFGSATGGTVSGFGMQTSPGGGSIFGGAQPSQQPSPFAPANTNAASIFGGQKTESTNVFGSPSQSGAAGTNFFGSTTFGDSGQTTGSIFGGANTTPVQPGAFATQAFNQSPFSNVQQQQQQQQQSASPFSAATNNSGFGSGAGGFGGTSAFGQSTGFNTATSMNSAGLFAPAGQPSVIQSGFGSTTAFAKPAFGAAPAFGSPPTFGGTPTFGGGATFGSPKGTFSSFAGQNSPPPLSSPTQNNNLFETLGSTDTGLSFSNLAQNTNNAAAKPQFGGSSFSSWR